jgi:hypothetical protein
MADAMSVILAELTSAFRTVGLMVSGRLKMPRDIVGSWLDFADGTSSLVYRVSTLAGVATVEPVVLIVRFKLRLVGGNRLAHALFRLESVLNTPLFAGHRGFRVKLWLTDPRDGFYRGIYQWDGFHSAERYAAVISRVLLPFCVSGSVERVSIADTEIDEFTSGVWSPPDGLSVPGWCVPRSADLEASQV